VELQAQELGNDGGITGDAGLDETLHDRLHVVGATFARVESALQLREAAGSQPEHRERHH
jgi:hypothetical protein